MTLTTFSREDMQVGSEKFSRDLRSRPWNFLWLSLCLLLLAGCGTSTVTANSGVKVRPAVKQVLVFPNVGVQDFDNLDPAEGSNENSLLAMDMIYSGLVRLDQNLNVIADQATWMISPNQKVYTFYLKPGITFSDGTPVTAQTYAYTFSRALLPTFQSGNAILYFGNIVGATAVNTGKTQVLSGIKVINNVTLVITLSRPTAYFLQALANPLAFPLNQKSIQRYGEANWSEDLVGNGVGTGPFIVKSWEHGTKMVFVPNQRYYGPHTNLSEVDMIFASDPHTAFQAYQGGQYNLVWNMLPSDLAAAHGLSGYVNQALLETDALFFNTQTAPFNQLALRQAFAYAIDKTTLTQSALFNSAVPAPTIIPPGIPGYQPNLTALSFDRVKALSSLESIYPDISQVPSITFSYPTSSVSSTLAATLQAMWQAALGIRVQLLPVETDAYNIEVAAHQVQFGFTQWNADFPDPYDALALNLLSTAPGNDGQWQNDQFDQLIQQAEQSSGSTRFALYAQAEQLAITNVGWLPLDHETLAAVIPTYVHGVSLNSMGLYFGNWSNVYLLPH
jgi:oligopeptide transport system substrate-binding protein